MRPQLTVVVDLDSLLGGRGALGGELGWAEPLSPEACRRLACDSVVTRVVVTRQPGDPCGRHGRHHHPGGDLDGDGGLAGRLQAAMAVLPPVLGGAPSQPVDVGRASRVITPAQRSALAVRDGGCVFPDCQRPLAWCEGHHLVSWLDGGPTDLDNLALLCRAHRAVHERGWQLTRGPDGRFTATPPHRRPRRTDDNRPRPEPNERQLAAASISRTAGRLSLPCGGPPPCQVHGWGPNDSDPPP